MRPDDRRERFEGPGDGPLDADLVGLDAELADAGAYARRAHAGQAQPTAAFAARLRRQLLPGIGVSAGSTSPGSARDARAWRGLGQPARASTLAALVEPGEAWAPVTVAPRASTRRPVAAPRGRWTLIAAAALSLAVVAAALGAGLGRLLPRPVADPTSTPTESGVRTDPPALPSTPSDLPAVVPPTDSPAESPEPTGAPTIVPTRTPSPTAKPTAKPDPTKPPIGAMELALKACPGGVVIDWTKPSPAVGHYHVLRSLGGDVPAAYPADGTTDIETATSTSAGVTDGFDATIDGGVSATYRAFAFDASDHLLAYSPARTVTTIGRQDLGALTVEAVGPGALDVAWAAPEVSAGCFTYGKLVASTEDPDPSYLKGSPYLAVIGDAGATGTHLDGLPSGTTVWMRYEVIRATSLGKFVVARTTVVQVTYP